MALDSLAEQVRDADLARQEGIALHALLQHLGKVDPALWDQIVPKALVALLPDAPDLHRPIGAKAMSILRRPELASLFGPGSRAEVPFLVDAKRDGADIRLAGRIDRLVIDDHGVMVVDYKSDASVPGGPGDVPGNYVTQLGLYALVAGQLFPRTTSARGNTVDTTGIIDESAVRPTRGRRTGLHHAVSVLAPWLDSYQL